MDKPIILAAVLIVLVVGYWRFVKDEGFPQSYLHSLYFYACSVGCLVVFLIAAQFSNLTLVELAMVKEVRHYIQIWLLVSVWCFVHATIGLIKIRFFGE